MSKDALHHLKKMPWDQEWPATLVITTMEAKLAADEFQFFVNPVKVCILALIGIFSFNSDYKQN